MTNTIDLDKLEQEAKAATPGIWSTKTGNGWANIYIEASNNGGRSDTVASLPANYINHAQWVANANLIAAVNPAAVLELIRRLRAAEEDAKRWNAFIGSAHIRPLGSAGLNTPMANNYAHMGLEIWTVSGRSYSQKLLDQMDEETAQGRDWLTKYADIAIAAQGASHD